MLAGVPPFHDDDDLELMKKVKKGLGPESVETTIPSRFFFCDCRAGDGRNNTMYIFTVDSANDLGFPS